MTPRSTFRVKGQGHQVKKCYFRPHLTVSQAIFEVKGHMGRIQKSCGSRSKVNLEGLDHSSRAPSQKCDFRSYLTALQVMFEVKGHRSGSKVMLAKFKGHMAVTLRS